MSLVVLWLRLHFQYGGGVGSIPDWRPKILHAVWYDQNNEKIEYSFKFS